MLFQIKELLGNGRQWTLVVFNVENKNKNTKFIVGVPERPTLLSWADPDQRLLINNLLDVFLFCLPDVLFNFDFKATTAI